MTDNQIYERLRAAVEKLGNDESKTWGTRSLIADANRLGRARDTARPHAMSVEWRTAAFEVLRHIGRAGPASQTNRDECGTNPGNEAA